MRRRARTTFVGVGIRISIPDALKRFPFDRWAWCLLYDGASGVDLIGLIH